MTASIIALARSIIILGPPYLELELVGSRWLVRDIRGRRLGVLPSAEA